MTELKPCPFCKQNAVFIGVHDNEGNFKGLPGCKYELKPWSGLSYALHHEGWGDCILCTDGENEPMGGVLFDTAEEAAEEWNGGCKRMSYFAYHEQKQEQEKSVKMAELKSCEYCSLVPELQRGIEFGTNQERFRYCCPRCNIASKSAYTIMGAVEAWNRSVDDEPCL